MGKQPMAVKTTHSERGVPPGAGMEKTFTLPVIFPVVEPGWLIFMDKGG
jgi:hypothetical protein